MKQDLDEQVDRLLHDAEHADSGAMMADMMRDSKSVIRFVAKRKRLIAKALKLDPERKADAWSQTRLAIPP